MLRDLWMLSLAVRLIAVVIGLFRAPRSWVLWAGFYLSTGITLRVVDLTHPGPHAYINLWCLQQIGSAILLAFVVSKTIKPAELLVQLSVLAALVAAGVVSEASHWPGSPTETVMWICGGVSLALGIISTVGSVVKFTAESAILSGFLILYSALMLAGSDYLNSANLGSAWSVLEIAAFGAWGVYFVISRREP